MKVKIQVFWALMLFTNISEQCTASILGVRQLDDHDHGGTVLLQNVSNYQLIWLNILEDFNSDNLTLVRIKVLPSSQPQRVHGKTSLLFCQR